MGLLNTNHKAKLCSSSAEISGTKGAIHSSYRHRREVASETGRIARLDYIDLEIVAVFVVFRECTVTNCCVSLWLVSGDGQERPVDFYISFPDTTILKF